MINASVPFEPITLEKQSIYRDLLQKCHQQASDYSFINLWGWSQIYGLSWAWEDDLVWIKQSLPEEQLWAPVGLWQQIDWKRHFESALLEAATFIRVPEKLLQVWHQQLGGAVSVQETRGHWDYLYQVDDLVQLKGNRYHKKKNLVNQFKRTYSYHYLNLSAGMVHQALEMQNDWCTWRDCEAHETLAAENEVIARVLNDWHRIEGLMGGAILVGDRMVSYTIAEALNDTTVLIHFEKGDPGYKGSYQAINQMFLKEMQGRFDLVNREQDLGNPGLRKAKLSYHPDDFIRKNRIIIQKAA